MEFIENEQISRERSQRLISEKYSKYVTNYVSYVNQMLVDNNFMRNK